MTTTKDLICFNCKHFDIIEGGCSAFPDGIPDIILLTNKHSIQVFHGPLNIVAVKANGVSNPGAIV